jgi:hypothetical protein
VLDPVGSSNNSELNGATVVAEPSGWHFGCSTAGSVVATPTTTASGSPAASGHPIGGLGLALGLVLCLAPLENRRIPQSTPAPASLDLDPDQARRADHRGHPGQRAYPRVDDLGRLQPCNHGHRGHLMGRPGDARVMHGATVTTFYRPTMRLSRFVSATRTERAMSTPEPTRSSGAARRSIGRRASSSG